MAADPESVNFLELACLFKITTDTTLERFGGMINASVFDAANITGSLKQKGLIDFTAYYPGPNSIQLTDVGKKLEQDAETKSAEPLDNLDDEILRQLSGGKRYPNELQSTLNVRPKDMAFRIYKLFKQSYLSYELKSGGVDLMLTEQGFLKAKTPRPPAPQPQEAQARTQAQGTGAAAPQQQAKATPPFGGAETQQAQGNGQELNRMAGELKLHGKPHKLRNAAIAVVVIVALLIIAYYYGIV